MKRVNRVKPVKPKRSIKDIRLWLGFIFVLTSVLLTQNLLAKATARTQAVIIQNEIPAGSPIRSTDLALVNVVLPEGIKTISTLSQADGMRATRDLFVGDILTTDSIADDADKSLRLVSVPIRAGHLPNLDFGQLVDVWMTPSIDGMALPGPAQLLISQAIINMIPDGIDPTLDTAVTLLIPSNQVQVLVQAMRDGVIDIVALPENRRTRS